MKESTGEAFTSKFFKDESGEGRDIIEACFTYNPVPTYVWRRSAEDFILIAYNRAAEEITNDQVANFLGQRATEIYADIPQPLADLKLFWLEKKFIKKEITYRLMPGSESKFLLVSYVSVPPDIIMVHTEDITERKLAEQRLRQSEERLRELVETVNTIPWEFDPATQRFTYVGPQAETILGHSLEDWYQKDFWSDKIHAEDREQAVATCRQACHDGFDHELEYRFQSADDSYHWLRDIVHCVTENGQTKLLRGFMFDITQHKEAEAALRESQEKYRNLIENAIDIIYSHDLLGRYTSLNRAGEEITGYTREEVLKMNFIDVVAPEHKEKARQMLKDKLKGTERSAYEVDIIAKDGRRLTVEVSTTMIYENGVPAGVQGIARDVTERKQLESQLRQVQKMDAVGQLAGGVAHDFNNLLVVINGYADLILRKLTDESLRQKIHEIKKAGNRAAGLTRQLLAFSRRQILQPKLINFNSVIINVSGMLERLIGEHIDFTLSLDPSLGQVIADPSQIEQVIINLCVNARDAMPEGGQLSVETKNYHFDREYIDRQVTIRPGDYAMLAVQDTGTGMDAETQAHIFEPFFTTKEVGKGTGLGLSTAYGIVKQSGGYILVDSEVGVGTCFRVYLPQASGETFEGEAGQSETTLVRGDETVLLVEDDDAVRQLTGETLRMCGYKLIEAASGGEALRLSEQYEEPIHLLVTDVVMPQMSGRSLAEQLIVFRPELKVLYISGYTDESVIQHGVIDETVAFIQKPFTPETLSSKVREVLDH